MPFQYSISEVTGKTLYRSHRMGVDGGLDSIEDCLTEASRIDLVKNRPFTVLVWKDIEYQNCFFFNAGGVCIGSSNNPGAHPANLKLQNIFDQKQEQNRERAKKLKMAAAAASEKIKREAQELVDQANQALDELELP